MYTTISQGYKAGGFNTDGTLDSDLRDFDSEGLLNYEIGFKGMLFDNRFQTQLALFFMNRDDVQISSSIVRTRDDGSSEFIDYIGNEFVLCFKQNAYHREASSLQSSIKKAQKA